MEDMVEHGSMLNKMPELPEVETVKNTLKNLIINKKIVSVDIYREKTILNDIRTFKDALINSTILNISRVGKYLIFHLDNDYVMIAHLRMEGKFFYKEEISPITKHDLVLFTFSDSTSLTYNDTRRFGILKVLSKNNYLNEDPLNKVGPDPFMMKDASRLIKEFKNKSIPIKSALLDQSIMSGLGNIYVDEVLFDTKVHPLTPAKDISKAKLEEILLSSKKILKQAIKQGGSTIKSYHPAEGISGEFQVNLKVYGHKDGKCTRCHHHLRKIFVNGRGTTYCPNCQKNISAPLVIGLTGPIGSGKSTASEYFLKKGFKVIDADKIVNELYSSKEVIDNLKRIIPTLKVSDNKVDKSFLRNYLVDNPAKKARLEKYIHSLVVSYIEERVNKAKKEDKLLLEVPLLFESHLDDLTDFTIYINVDKENQLKHLSYRGDDIDKMLKINKSFDAKNNMKKATYVIDNNFDVAYLNNELDKIIFDKVTLH